MSLSRDFKQKIEQRAQRQPALAKAMLNGSLHHMLSSGGNPSMDNLTTIFGAMRKSLKVDMRLHTVRTA